MDPVGALARSYRQIIPGGVIYMSTLETPRKGRIATTSRVATAESTTPACLDLEAQYDAKACVQMMKMKKASLCGSSYRVAKPAHRTFTWVSLNVGQPWLAPSAGEVCRLRVSTHARKLAGGVS